MRQILFRLIGILEVAGGAYGMKLMDSAISELLEAGRIQRQGVVLIEKTRRILGCPFEPDFKVQVWAG